MELALDTTDLASRLVALTAIHLRRRAGQPLVGPVHDRRHHLQIAPQFGGWRRSRRRFQVPLRFQKQLGLIEKAFSDCRRAVAPGGIQLPGLPRVEPMPHERRRHPLAIIQADARGALWARNQILHRQVRRHLALAHLLLDRFREKLDQRQPPRHPTDAAIEPPGQLLESIAEALLQLRQQPALFQRRLVFAQPQRTIQHQRLGLAHRPDHRLHRVPAQLLQRRDPLVAVDDQVAVWLAGGGYHHDGRLLAGFGQRRQQPPLPSGIADSQMLKAPVELVKLQLHRLLSCRDHSMQEPGTGLSRREGEVCRKLPSDQ